MKCKRITFDDPIKPGKPHVLLGIVTAEDSHFYYFKTKNKTYTIAKRLVLSLAETHEDYIEGNKDDLR